jgi:hypothetical protein
MASRRLKSQPSIHLCVHIHFPLRVAFIEVLEDGGAFLLINLGRIGARQAQIELIFDRFRYARSGGQMFPPVQNEQLPQAYSRYESLCGGPL